VFHRTRSHGRCRNEYTPPTAVRFNQTTRRIMWKAVAGASDRTKVATHHHATRDSMVTTMRTNFLRRNRDSSEPGLQRRPPPLQGNPIVPGKRQKTCASLASCPGFALADPLNLITARQLSSCRRFVNGIRDEFRFSQNLNTTRHLWAIRVHAFSFTKPVPRPV
jgi:hypothetical protein